MAMKQMGMKFFGTPIRAVKTIGVTLLISAVAFAAFYPKHNKYDVQTEAALSASQAPKSTSVQASTPAQDSTDHFGLSQSPDKLIKKISLYKSQGKFLRAAQACEEFLLICNPGSKAYSEYSKKAYENFVASAQQTLATHIMANMRTVDKAIYFYNRALEYAQTEKETTSIYSIIATLRIKQGVHTQSYAGTNGSTHSAGWYLNEGKKYAELTGDPTLYGNVYEATPKDSTTFQFP